jgi:hypothetical protein
MNTLSHDTFKTIIYGAIKGFFMSEFEGLIKDFVKNTKGSETKKGFVKILEDTLKDMVSFDGDKIYNMVKYSVLNYGNKEYIAPHLREYIPWKVTDEIMQPMLLTIEKYFIGDYDDSNLTKDMIVSFISIYIFDYIYKYIIGRFFHKSEVFNMEFSNNTIKSINPQNTETKKQIIRNKMMEFEKPSNSFSKAMNSYSDNYDVYF